MSIALSWPDNPFWTFSLQLYAKRDVAPACLALQDRYGLDVNVLLYCVWLGAVRGVTLDESDMKRIVASVAEWNDGIVVRLRALRADLKNNPHGAESGMSDALRNEVNRCELDAERIEQQILFTQNWSDAPGATRSNFVAQSNVRAYLKCLGIQPDLSDEKQVGSILGGLDV